MDKLAYSIADSASLAGVGITKIKEAVRLGELEARKAGRRTLITRAALSAWIDGLPKIHDRNLRSSTADKSLAIDRKSSR
jgi:excisionase family DNA binding protein